MTRRLLTALAIACVLILAAPVLASAHADLVSSDPASGATLATAPTEIRLTYSEAPDPGVSAVDLLSSGGATLRTGTPTLDGATTLVVPIADPLPDGVYTVSWRVVSADDGHVTAGAFPFGVGTSPGTGVAAPATGGPASGPTLLGVIGKSALYAGLMMLVAIAVVGMGLFHDAPRARRPLGLIAGVIAFVGAIASLGAQQRAIDVSMRTYLHAGVARVPMKIVAVSLVALVLAVIATRSPGRWSPWAAGAAAAVALALRAHGGHAAAAPVPVVAELTQWIHMLAGACWAGGLVLLLLLLRERRDDPPLDEAHRYSTMAVGAIAIVVASGLMRAVAELGGWSGVAQTLQDRKSVV